LVNLWNNQIKNKYDEFWIKKLTVIIAVTITILVALSMAGTYLLDSNKYSFQDFKGPHKNAENLQHSTFFDGQKMLSQHNSRQDEPDFEKMTQTIFKRVDTNSDNLITKEEVEATLKLSINERVNKKASFNTKRRQIPQII
jgi:hypothetical protein